MKKALILIGIGVVLLVVGLTFWQLRQEPPQTVAEAVPTKPTADWFGVMAQTAVAKVPSWIAPSATSTPIARLPTPPLAGPTATSQATATALATVDKPTPPTAGPTPTFGPLDKARIWWEPQWQPPFGVVEAAWSGGTSAVCYCSAEAVHWEDPEYIVRVPNGTYLPVFGSTLAAMPWPPRDGSRELLEVKLPPDIKIGLGCRGRITVFIRGPWTKRVE